MYTFYAVFAWVLLKGSHNTFLNATIYFTYDNLENFTQTIIILVRNTLGSFKVYILTKSIRLLRGQKSLTFWTLTFCLFCTMVGISPLSWVILPFLDNSVKMGELCIEEWYPYNVKILIFNELTYLYQCVASCYFCTGIVNIDLLIAALMTHFGIQCDMLCDNLKELQSTSKTQHNFSKKFVSCVEHRRQILR